MPATDVNAELSNLVYEDDPKLPEHLVDAGWEKISDWPLNNGYAGSAFINPHTNEIVIAHRGTDNAGDWLNNVAHASGVDVETLKDVVSVGMTINGDDPSEIADISSQFNEADAFTQSVLNVIKKNPKYADFDISHTGHSMGGFTAKIMGAKHMHSSEGFDPNPTEAYLDHLKEEGIISQENIDFIHQNSTVHISEGSGMDLIFDPEDYSGNVFQFNLGDDVEGFDLYEKHSMDNILAAFNKSTGMFKDAEIIKQVDNSPQEDYQEIEENEGITLDMPPDPLTTAELESVDDAADITDITADDTAQQLLNNLEVLRSAVNRI